MTVAAARAPALELIGLGKSYGGRVAVKSVDLAVSRGEIFGLLGPNGAGKTTTISAACGVIEPSRGTSKISGHDMKTDRVAAKQKIGLVPQDLAIYEDLTPRQNLAFFGQLYGITGAELARRIDEALAVAELADRSTDIVKAFSGGMKRRLNLAVGLVHKPELLILDEPTVGVDPQSRRHIFDAIRRLRDDGLTVIYTSHYMEEIEELCDRIAIMDAGAIVAQGTLAELAASQGPGGTEIALAGTPQQIEDAITAACALGATKTGESLQVAPDATLAPLLAAIEDAGARVKSIGSKRADLETVFLTLTGRGLRDA